MFVIVMPAIFMEVFSMNGSSETSSSLSKRSNSCTRNSLLLCPSSPGCIGG